MQGTKMFQLVSLILQFSWNKKLVWDGDLMLDSN